MIPQPLTILLHRLYRNKLSSFLNIAGLSIGIGVSLIIFMIIRNELSIDGFHHNRDRIYRAVSTETYRDGAVDFDGDVPIPFGDAIRREFPQAEQVASMWNMSYEEFQLADQPDKKFRTSDAFYIEPSFFKIFDFPWLAGNPDAALQQPNTMALARGVASAWFGNWKEAVGKTVLVGRDKRPFRITGVMEDVPYNSDIQLKVVCSYITFRNNNKATFSDPGMWDSFNPSSQCFFLLGKNQQISSMDNQLPAFVARYYTPLAATSNTSNSSFFQPLKDMHFDDRFYRFATNGFSYVELWVMGSIGLFILLMACVNFINLSTAQSLNRGKEIGVRKVLGSTPTRLFSAFMTETAMLVMMSLLLCVLIALCGWKFVTNILQKNIPIDSFASVDVLVFLLVTGMVVAFMAGSYPALVLSRFQPISALRSKRTNNGGSSFLRRGMITFQFTIAQLLIIGTLVVTSQMTFFRHRPMGFDKEAILLINLPYMGDGILRNEMFRQQALQIGGVISASLCSNAPSAENTGSTYFSFDNHPQPENNKIAFRSGDSSYLSTFNLSLSAGRYPFANDSIKEVLLNETTVKFLGLNAPEDIVGKTLRWSNGDRLTIVGVLKDFHEGSLKDKILPLAMFATSRDFRTLAVKINPGMLTTTIPKLEKLFETQYPDKFFDAPFFDDTIAAYYNSEAIVLTLFRIFAALGIFISCLGLYGLVSFMTFQRNKEVGIRKVLGASAKSIILLFSSEFTILIGISFLIAAPLGYYFMNQWVHSFYYHIHIDWPVFAWTLLTSVAIAWIAVGYKSIKAALENPVKSLKSE